MMPFDAGAAQEEEEEEEEEECTPTKYFLKALLGRGVSLAPVAFNNPESGIRCVALKYRTEEKLPLMYDKQLLSLMFDGSPEEIREHVLGHGIANAQNANGETVLMKVCRRALTARKCNNLGVVSLLLEFGANPLVCCDSGKNVLHDVFWSAKPPPIEVLEAMERMVLILYEATGRRGMLELFLSADKHGYTPLDYVVPAKQPNWRRIVDTVVDWVAEACPESPVVVVTTEAPESGVGSSEAPSQLAAAAEGGAAAQAAAAAPLEEAAVAASYRCLARTLALKFTSAMTVEALLDDLDLDDMAILGQLAERTCPCLISDVDDPDAAIIAVSHAFARETGFTADEVLGRNCRFLQGPGTSMRQIEAIRRAIAHKGSVMVSLVNYKNCGARFLNEFMLTPLRRKTSRRVAYFVGIQRCPEAIVRDRKTRLARRHALEKDDAATPSQWWFECDEEPQPALTNHPPPAVDAPDDDPPWTAARPLLGDPADLLRDQLAAITGGAGCQNTKKRAPTVDVADLEAATDEVGHHIITAKKKHHPFSSANSDASDASDAAPPSSTASAVESPLNPHDVLDLHPKKDNGDTPTSSENCGIS